MCVDLCSFRRTCREIPQHAQHEDGRGRRGRLCVPSVRYQLLSRCFRNLTRIRWPEQRFSFLFRGSYWGVLSGVVKFGALRCILDKPSAPRKLPWCNNGRLTLVLPHRASAVGAASGGVAGWLLLHCCRKRPAGARVFPSSEVTKAPGRAGTVWGAQAQTRAPASLCSAHSSRS